MAIYRRPTMPRSTKRFRKNVKARSPWTAKRSSNVLTIARVPGIRRPDFGFPDRMVTKLRYVDNFNLTGAAGVVGANVFRFNSCFDPDLSGVGHQPMYFDQFCGAAGTGPYGRYRVISAKATVSFMQTNPPAIAATNWALLSLVFRPVRLVVSMLRTFLVCVRQAILLGPNWVTRQVATI